jgi:NADP-dependent 3-hydroxy acid dehydrogenase YdfG
MARIADASLEEWKQLYDANFFSALALVSWMLRAHKELEG